MNICTFVDTIGLNLSKTVYPVMNSRLECVILCLSSGNRGWRRENASEALILRGFRELPRALRELTD